MLEDSLKQVGLTVQYGGDQELLEASVSLNGEMFYGYSSVSKDYALLDLVRDLPEHVALAVQKKAGLLA